MIRVRTVFAAALALAIIATPPLLAHVSTFGDVSVANAAPASGAELAGQQDGSTALWNDGEGDGNDNHHWSGRNGNDNRNWHRDGDGRDGRPWQGWQGPERREPPRFSPFRWLPWAPWRRDH
ncbi:MAG: hypothetical protein U0893_18085 [Chloroflexota bacterium]